MSVEISIQPRHAYLHVTLSGHLEMRRAGALLQRILESSIEYKLSKVLIDCTAVEGVPTTVERFEFSEFLAAQQWQLSAKAGVSVPRIALVGKEPFIDREKIGETIARNRGAIYKVTSTVAEALQWLEVYTGDVRQEPGE